MLPVDVFQIETLHPPFADGLFVAVAQKQLIVDLFTAAHKAFNQRFVQILHGAFDVRGGEFVFDACIFITVQTAQLPPQDILQQHMVMAAALLPAVLRRDIRISHDLKQFQRRLLGGIRFQIRLFVHEISFVSCLFHQSFSP